MKTVAELKPPGALADSRQLKRFAILQYRHWLSNESSVYQSKPIRPLLTLQFY